MCLVRPKTIAHGETLTPISRLRSARLTAGLPWDDSTDAAFGAGAGGDGAEYPPLATPVQPVVVGEPGQGMVLGGRVCVVAGDISQSRLGVPFAVWDRLAHSVDAIFHNGRWLLS